jgi:hypothetical protein
MIDGEQVERRFSGGRWRDAANSRRAQLQPRLTHHAGEEGGADRHLLCRHHPQAGGEQFGLASAATGGRDLGRGDDELGEQHHTGEGTATDP